MLPIVYFAILGLLGVVLLFNLILLLWLAIKTTMCLTEASQSRRLLSSQKRPPLPNAALAQTQGGHP